LRQNICIFKFVDIVRSYHSGRGHIQTRHGISGAGRLTVYLAVLSVGLPFVPLSALAGVRFEFFLFGATLLGVALFHKHTFAVAICGLAGILLFKFLNSSEFNLLEHFFGTAALMQQLMDKEMRQGEWPILLNLFGVLLGFSVLSKIFEESRVPDALPRFLPDDWKGPFILLVMVFVLSSFFDNIAAAMIGGTIAAVVFQKKVHLGFIAAIVAASNAGGAGSVIGDTTTTMMWIDGVSPLSVVTGYAGSICAFAVFGIIASFQQDRYHRIVENALPDVKIRWKNIIVIVMVLAGTITTNYLLDFPAIGVWVGIVLGSLLIPMPWAETKNAVTGSLFLLSLVTCASLMPVDTLPPASRQMALLLGFASSVFDNIP
jgi:Na+/H+ antiporter NhaD/arsenite permease-like protein